MPATPEPAWSTEGEVASGPRMAEELPSDDFCMEVNEDLDMVENAQDMVSQVVMDKDLEQKAADLVSVMDALQAVGVQPVEALRYAQSLARKDVRFMEVYGRGNIVKTANQSMRSLNVHGLSALDLRTHKENGETWDFTKASDRAEARDKLIKDKPEWLIGAPPCTAFSQWMHINYKKMKAADVKR